MNYSQIRSAACADLKGHWAQAAKLTFVYVLLCGFTAYLLWKLYLGADLLWCFIIMPLDWGYTVCFLRNARSEADTFGIGNLFPGYCSGRVFTTLLLEVVYIFLWTLLLVVPGIIKMLSYALTPFILCDYPELKNQSALRLSSTMMKGHKWHLFCLLLSFIGWTLLAVLTLCIGFIWLKPYMYASLVQFYEQARDEYGQKNVNPVI